MSQTPPRAFTYTVLQLVPCLERGERVNLGVALHCRQHDYLGIRTALRPDRIAAIAPGFDLDRVGRSLEEITAIIEGDPAAGTLASLPAPERFGWLVAPSSTAIQPSGTHTGLTGDPEAELERLFRRLVL